MLAEREVELPVVTAVYVALEIEEPQVAGIGGALPEGGPEQVEVHPIHIAIPVAVAEQTEERLSAVPARAVVVRRRAAADPGPGEGGHSHGSAAHDGCGNVQVHQAAALPLQVEG